MKWISAIALLLCSGCIVDDFNDMGEGFIPISPRDAALMAVDQYNPDHRRQGITLLANSNFGGAPEYLAMYRDYVAEDRDPLVRAAAMKALARFGSGDDAKLIAMWLSRTNTQSTQVRRAAAIALQRLHNTAVVPILLRSLSDSDEENQVRTAVATALGQYPENQVFVGLIAALQANDLAINKAASESLCILTGQVFGTDWDAWYEWGQRVVDTNTALFAAKSEFQYPTYRYESRWWDSIVFWDNKINERPDVPAGLKEQTRKTTYDDGTDPSK